MEQGGGGLRGRLRALFTRERPLAVSAPGLSEIPDEVLEAIRHIAIRARRLVDESLSGAYHSVFKGVGMEFREVREYVPGDDVRAIDWNVTARADRPHVKIFEEERELNVVLAADLSHSCQFGSGAKTRRDIIAEICGVLGLAAAENKDKVGLLLFTDRVEHYIPPARGRNHVMRMILELMAWQPERPGTNLKLALDYLGSVLKRRATVFLVSDFWTGDVSSSLRSLARRHDVVAIRVRDALEQELPAAGLVHWHDAETGRDVLLDTSHRATRRAYADKVAVADRSFRRDLNSARVDLIDILNHRSYVEPLIRFFSLRAARKGRTR